MIAFDLQCRRGHCFEGWFESSRDFEDQNSSGLVECPICGDPQITKVLSPIRSLGYNQPGEPEEGGDPETREKVVQAQNFLKAAKIFLETNFEDVGAEFAKEALKIHYGVEPSRNIRGSSTEMEEEMLKDEGVEFLKMPLPKDLD